MALGHHATSSHLSFSDRVSLAPAGLVEFKDVCHSAQFLYSQISASLGSDLDKLSVIEGSENPS